MKKRFQLSKSTSLISSQPKFTTSGFGLIEVVVGASIISVSLVAIIFVFQGIIGLSQDNLRGVQAAFLAEEGLEVMRSWRNQDWQNLTNLETGTDYGLTFSLASGWQIENEIILVDGLFDRRLRLEEVYRDGNNEIAPTGTLDPESYQIVSSVAWNNGQATSTKIVTTYLMNILSE